MVIFIRLICYYSCYYLSCADKLHQTDRLNSTCYQFDNFLLKAIQLDLEQKSISSIFYSFCSRFSDFICLWKNFKLRVAIVLSFVSSHDAKIIRSKTLSKRLTIWFLKSFGSIDFPSNKILHFFRPNTVYLRYLFWTEAKIY